MSLLTERLTRRSGEAGYNPYIPHTPTPPQAAFLSLKNKEALYGGAAGGGKSDALLMAALEYVKVPDYSAILFRRTFQDLSLPDALIPRSHQWLAATDAKWEALTHTWHFPNNAKLTFGYMDKPNDHFRYQGAAFQFVGFDELTQFEETQYLFMFSRLRATVGVNAPLRMRGTSNPGGVGHRWVKRRFIDQATRATDAVYVPARLKDNPYLREDYRDSLEYLDPVTKAQYLEGDWTVIGDNVFVFPEFDRQTHASRHRPSDDPNFYPLRVAGADPGTRDPYAVVILGRTAEGIWWVLEEFYRTGGSTARWQNEFQAMQARWKCPRWWVDKRKPSDRMDLQNAGLPALANLDIHGETERDTIRPMLVVPQTIMHEGRLFVDSRCEHTIHEFEEYRYRDAEDRNAGEVPIDADNHAMDGIRYALCSTEGVYKGPPQLFRRGPLGEFQPRPPPRIGPVVMRRSLGEAIMAEDKRMEAEDARRAAGRRV